MSLQISSPLSRTLGASTPRAAAWLRVTCIVGAAVAAGCSSSDATVLGMPLEGERPAPSAPPPAPAQPRHVFASMVAGQEGENTYVGVLSSLELGGTEVSLADAREFPGSADLWVLGSALYVASGDSPRVTRFSLDAGGQLVEGESVSFASYGLPSAAFWNNTFVDASRAYMANGASELVIWNPTTMRIEGTLELPPLPDRGGLVARLGLADRASIVQAGKLYQPIYWTDENYADRSPDSRIAVIDVASNTFVEYLEAPCPSLDYATRDEAGTLYFSNWTGSVGTHFVLGTAANCVVSVDPTSGALTRAFGFAEVTGGREGAALAHAGAGRFVMSVFHQENVDLAAADDPFAIVGARNWRLYAYTPASSAIPLEGIDWNSGAVYYGRSGARVLPLVPGADYSTTDVYELGAGASTAKLFSATGWVIRLFEVAGGP